LVAHDISWLHTDGATAELTEIAGVGSPARTIRALEPSGLAPPMRGEGGTSPCTRHVAEHNAMESEVHMNTQHSWSLAAAGVLACAVIGVTPRPASAQLIGPLTEDHHKLPVTAVGCLQTEKDYRHLHDSGRGGFLRTGAGEGDEYILVHATVGVASMHVEPATEAENANCLASPDNGQAIELTGHPERDLAPFVGRRVVISGMLKHAKHDPEAVGTSGAFTPVPTSGGIDITGAELKLREINVESFALAPVMAPRAEEEAAIAIAPAEPGPVASAPEPAPEPAAEPQAPQTAAAPELPKTASPLPTIGLIGLLSLAGALGLRLFGRVRLS
jgi:hypothetical protein